MERLTERTTEGILVKEDYGEGALKTLYQCFGAEVAPHYANCEEGYCAMERLTAYEDAEEQGLLWWLPPKEVYKSSGDTVHYIFDYEIVECINCGVSMDCEGKLWIALACDEHIFPYRNPDPEHDLDPTDWCINSTQVTIEEWGKTIFLTKEEAEQALKQMGE